MSPQEWIALFGVLSGVTGLGIGLRQYWRAQRWKRAEFVASEIKEFEARFGVRNAIWMLDWNDCEIDAGPDKTDPEKRWLKVNNGTVAEALRVETEKWQWIYPEDLVLDSFTVFFDGLERFGHFLEVGLIKPEDLFPYLRYWIETIGDPSRSRKPRAFVDAVCRHIDFYRYLGVQALFRAYGYDIRPK